MDFERQLPLACPGVVVTGVKEPADAAALARDAEIIITLGPHLGPDAAAIFEAATSLKWVQVIGTGVDNILGHPSLSPEVAVTNVQGVHGPQMSEAALSAMLAFARETRRLLENQSTRTWERFPARRLSGATVGIVGLGAIAEDLAARCQAMGMRVMGFTGAPRALQHFDEVFARDDLARHVGGTDYLIILTPHTPETHGLIGADVLAAMRPDAVLVNLARGGVVDEAALLQALRSGQIRGGALDVFAQEPLPADHPFWGLENVLITPHVGGFHRGYADDVRALIGANLKLYRAGGVTALKNRVNS